MSDPTTVLAGEHITTPGHDKGEVYNYIIRPAHEGGNGHWYCVTHQEPFSNNFQKDSHIDEGEHKLAWMCFEHDTYEEP